MQASKLGILSVAVASLCCLGPLLLILLGLGSLGIGAAIGKYHWYLIAAAILLLMLAWKSYFKKKKACDLKEQCKIENKRIALVTLIISTLIVAIFVGFNIYTYALQKDFADKKTKTELIETETAVIPVEGMTCFTCEIAVSSSLNKLKGVVNVKASAKEGNVWVEFDPTRTNVEELVEAIHRIGYKAKLLNK